MALLHPCHPLGRLHRIIQQHCNRHWAYTTRNRTNPACLLADQLKVYIATQFTFRSLVCSHIDHDRPVAHHVGRHKLGFPDRDQ